MLWSLLPGGISHSPLYDQIAVGSLFLGALYFSYDRWRFPNATLVVDAPPVPGHAFRGRVETPLKREPASMRIRLRARHYVRKSGASSIWSCVIAAHPLRGQNGIVVPVEATIPAELANQPLSLDWDLTVQATVAFGLYRARFEVRTPQ